MNQDNFKTIVESIVKTIVKEIQPEKVILFGSWAWGNPGPDSDVDLFVIKNTKLSTRDIARTIDRALWGRIVPIDIIVSTPKSVNNRLKQRDFFVSDIIHKGKILYERN